MALGLIILLLGIGLFEAFDGSGIAPAAGPWSYLGVGGIFWVAPAVALLHGYLTAPDHHPRPACGTFGCGIDPRPLMFLGSLVGYFVCLVAGAVAMAVIAGTRAWRRNRWLA